MSLYLDCGCLRGPRRGRGEGAGEGGSSRQQGVSGGEWVCRGGEGNRHLIF